MSKYLITGGAGFIGSNLAERLVRDHHEVIIIDDFSTGSLVNIPDGVNECIAGSCADNLSKLAGSGIDAILHLGAPSNTLQYRKNRRLVGSAIDDFIQVLELAMSEKAKLVYASTSSMYQGNPIPWDEFMPVAPLDYYTEARICWERLASVYHQHYGVESIGMRMFAVYGQNERQKGTFANLLTQLLWAKQEGKAFEVWGNGGQMRDAIHIDDVVDAWLLAINSDIECDVFNIGTGKSYTINQMADMLCTSIIYVPCPIKNYVIEHQASTIKAKEGLGFEAKISIIEGIVKIERFYV